MSADDIGRWVQAARKGDLGAFDQLVRVYQRRASAVAYRLLNNIDDAMEVTQDAFMKAYESLATLSQPNQFGPWFMRIVSNLALNKRRARALRTTASLDAPGGGEDEGGTMDVGDPHASSPLEAVSAKEMQKNLSRAMSRLPEIQRKALVLFSMAKLPQKQVAKTLGCSVEAVKWHVFMARKKLKEIFKDYF
jgi:RNA polymerase sigma-70 factor (ECF subfamily)